MPTRSKLFAGIAAILALGWASREIAFARQQAETIASQTVTLDRVAMKDYENDGKTVGKIGIYLAGETSRSKDFVTGRLVLNAGETPHPPHVHAEEEVMIIESGTGEIVVGDKTTTIGAGSVMFTEPNVPHGIVNTGKEPIVFYFIKWAAKR